MSSPTAANPCNDYLSPDDRNSHSTRRRSTSVTPSARSSVSRITIVEDSPELASSHTPETRESQKTTTKIYAPRYTWFEHLLGLLCINVAARKEPIVKVEQALVLLEDSVIEEADTESDSPWILPVYVLSSRQDTDKNHVAKEAKCTIDTGNYQGNIVSRDFVLNVLQFPEENLRPLTKAEKKGATGITGDKFTPEGAIYLTWYHKKSTRVFRDMRFLISPQQQFDLIIGAHSIRAHNLLDVPNLMARNDRGFSYLYVPPDHRDSEDVRLDNDVYNARRRVVSLKHQLTTDPVHPERIQAKLVEAERQEAAAISQRDQHNKMHHLQLGPSDNKGFLPSTDPSNHFEETEHRHLDTSNDEKHSMFSRLWGPRASKRKQHDD